MPATGGRPLVSETASDEKQHRREIARALNRVITGQIGCNLTVTLTANASSTTVTDARATVQTAPILTPTTASAKTEWLNAACYAVATNGQVVINHTNSTDTTRTFILSFLG